MTESTPDLKSVDSLFDEGIERYQNGESTDTLIPFFQEVCARAKKNSPAWTCLSWLYLLGRQTQFGLQSCSKSGEIQS